MNRRINNRNAYKKEGHNYDTRDYFRAYRKKVKNPVTEKQYREIITDIFSDIIDNRLMKYMRVKLPARIGDIYIEDVKCGFKRTQGGKIWKQDLVDWQKTWALWKNEAELRKKRVYVYLDLASFARFKYRTYNQCFHNAKFYDLLPKSALKKRIFKELTMHE